MARIPESEIERIKGEIEIVRVVEGAGVELKGHGTKDLIGRCPFHDDKTPSLVVSPEKNLWHCLGACQAGGSVIDWTMKAQGVSFRHAVELLSSGELSFLDATAVRHRTRRGRPSRNASSTVAERTTVSALSLSTDAAASDGELLQEVVSYYHEQLLKSPKALSYLDKRGLGDEALLKTFQLGYSDRTLSYRLEKKNRKAGQAMRSRLEALGVFRARSGHEHLNGRVVFPIFDTGGCVVEMYGRTITSGLRKGTPSHLYLPGPHRGVWNLEGLRGQREVILCESVVDAATFWCAGFRNVTASYGVGGFTEDHWSAFEAQGIERVLIAYDRDEAGDQAAAVLSTKLGERGIATGRVEFPKGMDANELASKLQPAARSLRVVLEKAGASLAAADEAVVAEEAAAVEGVEEAAVIEDGVADRERAEAALGLGRPDANEEKGPEVDEEAGFPLLAAEAAAPLEAERGPVSLPGKPDSLSTEQAPPREGRVSAETTPSNSEASNSMATSRAVGPGLEASGEEWVLRRGDRRWRIRRLGKAQPGHLKLNLLVSRGDSFFVDTLELYSARQRGAFVQQASSELGLGGEALKGDLGRLLLLLEEQAERERQEEEAAKKKETELSEAERAEALSLLKSPKLLERVLGDFERCGVVGERTNKLVGYLAATSRLLDEPLAVVVQSSSAAGKSSLMEAVLAMLPEEQRVQYSAMTGQSLYYMGEANLSHKVLAISEEEGAERASYALKLLQSEGQLKIASTGKDPQTGRLVTQEYEVRGPVMIFLTTTAIDIDEELLNRCLVLSVDEGREQTRAIHELQRRAQTLAGLRAKHERAHVRRLHQNAQRLLRPLFVVNPHAERLSFSSRQTRTRRDHMKYLTLIRAVALLHQYQRPLRQLETVGADGQAQVVPYIEVTEGDIRVATELSREVLGRSLDELPPQTRRLLEQLLQLVEVRSTEFGMDPSDYRFSRREVREWTHWSYEQLRVHLGRLVECEHLAVHRGKRGQSYLYELCSAGCEEVGPFDGSEDELGEDEPCAPAADAPRGVGKTTTTEKFVGSGKSLGGRSGEFGVSLGGGDAGKKSNDVGGSAEKFGISESALGEDGAERRRASYLKPSKEKLSRVNGHKVDGRSIEGNGLNGSGPPDAPSPPSPPVGCA